MSDDLLVYVGTYTEPIRFGTGRVLEGKGEGIHVLRLDRGSGALTPVATTRGVTNPSYLAFDPTGRFLYAVNEVKVTDGAPSGTVSAFALDRRTGTLRFLDRQLTHGTDPCHVTVDAGGTHVFVANFMSGSVCVLPVREDGGLAEACQVIQHHGSSVDPIRQTGPHAHSVTLDPANRFACVPDLGLDRLMVYALDARRGALTPNRVPWLTLAPGAGPRHLAFHPDGALAVLINELDSTLVLLTHDTTAGTFEVVHAVSTLPAGFHGASTCADVHVAPSGTFVYGSNRGHDSIVVYRIDARARRLAHVGHQPTSGRTPRSFAIDPSGTFLLVANQDTDDIVTFRIDRDTGRLSPTGHSAAVPTPVCIKMLSRVDDAARGGS